MKSFATYLTEEGNTKDFKKYVLDTIEKETKRASHGFIKPNKRSASAGGSLLLFVTSEKFDQTAFEKFRNTLPKYLIQHQGFFEFKQKSTTPRVKNGVNHYDFDMVTFDAHNGGEYIKYNVEMAYYEADNNFALVVKKIGKAL